jgi:hypothetical protein
MLSITDFRTIKYALGHYQERAEDANCAIAALSEAPPFVPSDQVLPVLHNITPNDISAVQSPYPKPALQYKFFLMSRLVRS